MRPSSLLAVVGSAVLGVALGIGGGLALDRGTETFEDPLSLDFPMQNQSCTGSYLLVIGKGGPSALGAALASNPTGHYLDTGHSCPTAWTEEGRATPRWVAYLGPFGTGAQACEVRMTADHKGTTVTRLQSGLTDTRHCLCYLNFKAMPRLSTGMAAGITDSMWTRALQNVLVDMGRAKKADATGVYGFTTAAQIRQFQRDNNLSATGVVDAATWHTVQSTGCPLYDLPSTNASP